MEPLGNGQILKNLLELIFFFGVIFPTLLPLPQLMIIWLYYSYRVVLTYTITILTVKTALMAAFILDFNRMSGGKKIQNHKSSWNIFVRTLFFTTRPECMTGLQLKILTMTFINVCFTGYSDRFILRSSVALSIVLTLANVGLELGWKLSFGQNLIATSHTYIYMGMKVILYNLYIAHLSLFVKYWGSLCRVFFSLVPPLKVLSSKS